MTMWYLWNSREYLSTDFLVHTKLIIKPMELLLISLKFTNISYKTILQLSMYFDVGLTCYC